MGDPAGDPILLIHGFASSALVNWVHPGWLKTLGDAGYRVIAIDNRGHGHSDKPHHPSLYHVPLMASDAIALLDHLGIPEAHVMGYSMGARITAFAALAFPHRIRTIILAGSWHRHGDGRGRLGSDCGRAACTLAGRRDPRARPHVPRLCRPDKERPSGFAACIRLARPVERRAYGQDRHAGADRRRHKDDIAGSPQDLAMLMPHAEALDIPNRDHMLAVGDRVFKKAALEFLRKHS